MFFILFIFRSIIYRNYRYDILDYIYLKIHFSIKNRENKNNTLNHNKKNRIILIILIYIVLMNLNDIMILETIKSEKVIKSYYLIEFTVIKHGQIIDNVCILL